MRPVEAGGVEAERRYDLQPRGDVPVAEIGLGQGPDDRARKSEQPASRVRRSRLCRRARQLLLRQSEEGPCLAQRIAQAVEATVEPDQVKQIAMLAGRGVGLMFS